METEGALGFDEGAVHLATTEFTESQVQQFLSFSTNGKRTEIPAWLPTKPLFVSYLASHDLIDGIFDDSQVLDPAAGWDYLIDQVCERESAIDKRYLDFWAYLQ